MKSYKTEAIILKLKNIGEADKLITIFSKNHGKINLIAKGARRITSKKGPNLEIFNQVSILIHAGKSFDIITEAFLLNSFEELRKKLKLVGLAYIVCELVDKLTPERQESEKIYELICSTLLKLSNPIKEKNLIVDFKKQILIELGYLQRGDNSIQDIDKYIDSLTERELKSRKFLMRI